MIILNLVTSDDRTTDALITRNEHVTAGLVFRSGAHANIKTLTHAGGAPIQLFGRLRQEQLTRPKAFVRTGPV